MKLLVSQINEGENAYSFTSDTESWMKGIADHVKKEGYELKSPMVLNVLLTKLEPDYYLKGNLSFDVMQTCSRCAESFPFSTKHNFEVALAHVTHGTASRKLDLLSEESEELDIQFFEGNEIDLAPVIQEQFFLSQPYQALCKVDCRGVCQHCGQNLNLKAECGCTKVNPLSPFAVLKDKVTDL